MMVTIFTPVYNRRYIIGRLYESLKRQSCKDFEWIIVDDGSTDDLQADVYGWELEDNGFPIYYKHISNGGKHRAINIGVNMAHSEAFFIVDSDDFISSDAVAFIEEHFKEIEKKDGYAGISGLRRSSTGGVLGGEPCFSEYADATNLERERYGLSGDKAEVYKTCVLKRFPFPAYENENFLGEGIVWNRIAYEGLKIRWYNKTLVFCEYMKDGLTKNMLDILKKNPVGWAKSIAEERRFRYWDEKTLFYRTYRYYEALHNDFPKAEMCELLEISSGEYFMLRDKWLQNISEIKDIFWSHHLSNVAVYGMGSYGKRVLLYFDEMQIDVAYIIDKNDKELKCNAAYNLDMDLPMVDSVCVSLRKPPADLIQRIRRKLPKSFVWALTDIRTGVW